MQLEDIRRSGRQILEALKTLQDKGFPYGTLKIWENLEILNAIINAKPLCIPLHYIGHLHTGNILMEGNVAR